MNIFGSQEFTWILNSVFFFAILYAFVKAKSGLNSDRSNYVEYAPSLMTSLGLFGTFLGIFIGLLQFDSKHIDGSIEQLLGGLQTAFVTSLIGMGFAICFKIIQTSYLDKNNQNNDENSSTDEISPQDIYSILKNQHTELSLISKGIGGNDERSLVGQIQMLRTDVNDFRSGLFKRQERFEEELWSRMESFAKMLSKSATQQVIEALKEVIVDFNNNLTEQFGDNFKLLDESVKKLVEWQANYTVQIEAMTRLYEQGVDSISATKVAVQAIKEETARIPTDMQALGEILTVNQNQIAELERHLDAFVKMRDHAVIAVPQIQSKLEELGRQLINGAEKVNIALINGSQDFENSVKQTNVAMLANAKAISSESEKISEEMKNSMEILGLNTERIRSGITSVISNAMENIEESSRKIIAKSQEASKEILTSAQQSVQVSIEQSNQARDDSLRTVEEAGRTMIQTTERTLQAMDRQISNTIEAVGESSRNLMTSSQETTKLILTSAQQSVQASIEQSNQARAESLRSSEEASRAIVQNTDRTLQAVDRQIQEAVNRTNDAVNAQLRQLDEALSQQLNAALQELGAALATIAQHLTDTYKRNSQRS